MQGLNTYTGMAMLSFLLINERQLQFIRSAIWNTIKQSYKFISVTAQFTVHSSALYS
jgi:hypothetical protein